MSYEIHRLAKIAIEEEANSEFATDLTSTGTYIDLPFVEGTAEVTLTDAILEPETVQQYIDAYPLTVRGPKSAELSFDILLAPSGTLAPEGTPSIADTNSALARLLKIAMGGIDGANEGSVVDGSPANGHTFDVATGEGARFTAGGACAWINSSGRLEVREIESVSTDTIVLKVAFSETPSDTDVVYACTTVYLTDDPDTTLQAKVEGKESQDRWLLLGGQLSGLELATPIGELPRLSMTWTFADWLYGDDAASDMTSGALAAASYTNFSPVAFFDSSFIVQDVGVNTLNEVNTPADGLSIGLNLGYEAITGASGTNTIVRWRRNRTVPVSTVEYTTYFQDYGDFDDRDGRVRRHVALQCGSGAGTGAVLVTVPTAQVVNAQRVTAGEMAGVSVELRATIDADATNQATEIRRSAIRIHFA